MKLLWTFQRKLLCWRLSFVRWLISYWMTRLDQNDQSSIAQTLKTKPLRANQRSGNTVSLIHWIHTHPSRSKRQRSVLVWTTPIGKVRIAASCNRTSIQSMRSRTDRNSCRRTNPQPWICSTRVAWLYPTSLTLSRSKMRETPSREFIHSAWRNQWRMKVMIKLITLGQISRVIQWETS